MTLAESRGKAVFTRIPCYLLIALLALPLAGPAPLAEGKSRKKTVTRTFSNATFITIPGERASGLAAPYPSTINVSGLKKGKILDVNVILRNLNHTSPDEIDVLLTAAHLPGRTATVMSDVGGNDDAVDVTLTLDDNSGSRLPGSGPLGSGTFQPANDGASVDDFASPAPAPNGNALLNQFNSAQANGQWQLFVVDDGGGDTGSIAGGWSLEIKAKIKEKKKRRR
jgi:hypothetical protein